MLPVPRRPRTRRAQLARRMRRRGSAGGVRCVAARGVATPMRPPGPVFSLLLCACGSAWPGNDPAWNRIQQERLDRLHQVRDPDAALAAVLGREPPAPPQEPKPATAPRGDPPAPAPAARSFRHAVPDWVVYGAYGVGEVSAHVKGTLV